MFLATVIPLTALNTLPPESNLFFGRQTHALFLDLVARADSTLASALHQPRGDKPFTVSSPMPALAGGSQRARNFRRGALSLRTGEKFEWRLTTFEARLSEALLHQVLPHLPREVRVGAARFEVGAPITDRAKHPWAGTSDAFALWQQWFHGNPRVEKQFGLEFASPTAYRHIHRNMLVPLPEGIFTGYLAAWNAHGAPSLELDLLDQIAQKVAIRDYALETTSVDFGEFRQAGWHGKCRYTILSDDFALCRAIQLLADFAFYCGTGYKTTQGMGQTRRLAETRKTASGT